MDDAGRWRGGPRPGTFAADEGDVRRREDLSAGGTEVAGAVRTRRARGSPGVDLGHPGRGRRPPGSRGAHRRRQQRRVRDARRRPRDDARHDAAGPAVAAHRAARRRAGPATAAPRRAARGRRPPAGGGGAGPPAPPPLEEQLLAIRLPGRPPRVVRVQSHARFVGAQLLLTLITFADVTAEVEARRTIERITESVEELLFTATLDDAEGRLSLVYASPGLERLLGGPVAQGTATKASWFGAVHPDDREAARLSVRETAAGRPTTLEYRLVGV